MLMGPTSSQQEFFIVQFFNCNWEYYSHVNYNSALF